MIKSDRVKEHVTNHAQQFVLQKSTQKVSQLLGLKCCDEVCEDSEKVFASFSDEITSSTFIQQTLADLQTAKTSYM